MPWDDDILVLGTTGALSYDQRLFLRLPRWMIPVDNELLVKFGRRNGVTWWGLCLGLSFIK